MPSFLHDQFPKRKTDEFENYIGEKGATYVNISTNSIRTAFPKAEFTPGTIRFLDTVNKHLKKGGD